MYTGRFAGIASLSRLLFRPLDSSFRPASVPGPGPRVPGCPGARVPGWASPQGPTLQWCPGPPGRTPPPPEGLHARSPRKADIQRMGKLGSPKDAPSKHKENGHPQQICARIPGFVQNLDPPKLVNADLHHSQLGSLLKPWKTDTKSGRLHL